MTARPSTAAAHARKALVFAPATSASSTTASASSGAGASSRTRPQSADVGSPQPHAAATAVHHANSNVFKPTKDKANTSSEELIRDLERKVRKVVEQKRAESDKLRFTVAKRREDVDRAKLMLQDLLKDSDALGLHYSLAPAPASASGHAAAAAAAGTSAMVDTPQQLIADKDAESDATRLQPIVSISRRPVYSKHTKIHELEAKLERRAKEAHLVHRRTLVLEHVKKRLLSERIEVAQATNQLKQLFGELNTETQELQKKHITAAEAVNQVQTRLAQQKADMAANMRKFRRELALRQKWAREKAKFEKYYNDQLQAAMAKPSGGSSTGVAHFADNPVAPHAGAAATTTQVPIAQRRLRSPTSILKSRRSSLLEEQRLQEEAVEAVYREAFQRIGVDTRAGAIDPEEIIHTCLSHEELKHELDAKHDEAVQRIAQLREQIDKARSIAREDIPLSKRGTSQKIETKQLEISSVERQLATVVDQYMFVDQSVRPIKIGLQQILQNVSNETVNIDNMTALETSLVESCEEMMRLLRESTPQTAASAAAATATISGGSTTTVSTIPEDDVEEEEGGKDKVFVSDSTNTAAPPTTGEVTDHGDSASTKQDDGAAAVNAHDILSLDSFTSPFNVRIPAKTRERYFVAGLRPANAQTSNEEDEGEDNTFEVMDRAMVKRISSVVLCTSGSKKSKDKSKSHTTH